MNDTLKNSKTMKLYPQQETLEYFSVDLPEKGQFKIRIASLPLTLDQRLYIDFWVKRN
jgi:hypothetical protein